MVTLEALLQNVQGTKDIPSATRKSVGDHTHSDVYRGAVKQEKSLTRRLNGLVKAVREGRITRETAVKAAELAIGRQQEKLNEIALSRAKRALKKDVLTLPPEMSERLNRVCEESLKAFRTVLADVK